MKINGERSATGYHGEHDEQEGLTKREYFSIFALQGLLASGLHSENIYSCAVEAADKLLRELER